MTLPGRYVKTKSKCMMPKPVAILFLFILSVMGNILIAQTSQVFDIVLVGGRVLDPETKLDGIRNIGILGNRIAEVSTEPLQGKEMVSVAGLVVAPGFIDLHVHGVSNVEQ